MVLYGPCIPIYKMEQEMEKYKNLVNIYLFKVKYRNRRKKCETCSKLTIKAPNRRH